MVGVRFVWTSLLWLVWLVISILGHRLAEVALGVVCDTVALPSFDTPSSVTVGGRTLPLALPPGIRLGTETPTLLPDEGFLDLRGRLGARSDL